MDVGVRRQNRAPSGTGPPRSMLHWTGVWVFVTSYPDCVIPPGKTLRTGESARAVGNRYYGGEVPTARMGNIRQTYIKRVAIELVRHYPNDFGGDFAHNKQKVLELTDLGVVVEGKLTVVHKKLANRIAGYATRYLKRKRGT